MGRHVVHRRLLWRKVWRMDQEIIPRLVGWWECQAGILQLFTYYSPCGEPRDANGQRLIVLPG